MKITCRGIRIGTHSGATELLLLLLLLLLNTFAHNREQRLFRIYQSVSHWQGFFKFPYLGFFARNFRPIDILGKTGQKSDCLRENLHPFMIPRHDRSTELRQSFFVTYYTS
jgi:hypothetical protein